MPFIPCNRNSVCRNCRKYNLSLVQFTWSLVGFVLLMFDVLRNHRFSFMFLASSYLNMFPETTRKHSLNRLSNEVFAGSFPWNWFLSWFLALETTWTKILFQVHVVLFFLGTFLVSCKTCICFLPINVSTEKFYLKKVVYSASDQEVPFTLCNRNPICRKRRQ